MIPSLPYRSACASQPQFIDTQTMEAPLNVTFGLEIEFLVHFNKHEYDNELDHWDRTAWQQSTASRGEKLEFLVRERMIRVLRENDIETNGPGDRNFTRWTVDRDGSCHPDDGFHMKGAWCSVELQTPVFYHGATARAQVRQVVGLVMANFVIEVNYTCGLHVHVGNGSSGFPLGTLKNFCTLVTGFERQLSSLHPPARQQTPFAKTLGKVFKGVEPHARLRIIQAFRSQEELVQRFGLIDGNTDPYVTYNLYNLHFTSLHTIEFRQHAGTVDPAAINSWAELACELLVQSHARGPAGFADLVDSHFGDPGYFVEDLLRDLGLGELAEYYENRGVYDHPPQPSDWAEPDGEELEEGDICEDKQLDSYWGT